MKQYLDLMRHVRDHGSQKGDRTGTGTRSVFGYQMRFDLSAGFPLVTTKKCHLRSIIHELLWFLQGDTNIKYLKDNGVSIWDGWADEHGDLGPVYGYQWRSWPTPDGRHVDQVSEVVEQLINNPNSRRIIINAWNVADLPDESISPQANVKNHKMALALESPAPGGEADGMEHQENARQPRRHPVDRIVRLGGKPSKIPVTIV